MVINKSLPKTVTIVNPSCKLSCHHCGYPEFTETDAKEISQIIESLQREGHDVKLYDMDITESSLELFKQTGQYDDPKGFGWMNITESLDLNEKTLGELEKMTVGFCISLHGPTADISSRLAAPKARHERLLGQYKKLKDNLPDKPVGLAMVIHNGNINYIDSMVELGEELNVDFLEFINILYAGCAPKKMSPTSFLSERDLKKALNNIQTASKYAPFEIQLDSTWGPTSDIISPVTVIPEANYRNCGMFAPALDDKFCNAGYNHMGVRADNRLVFPCPGMSYYPELAMGHMDKDGKISIKDNWIKSPVEQEPCKPCESYDACKGGCRISAISEGLRLTGKIDRYAGQKNCAKYVSKQ